MGNEDETTFGQRMSARWNGFLKFLWNSETKEFLGRGGKSWGQISLFYFCFYTCLAAFWACMLLIFMQTVDYSRPKWVSYVSTPSLVVTPSELEERISYTPTNEATFSKTVDKLDDLWKKINESNFDEEAMPCNATLPGDKSEQRYCTFDLSTLGQYCTPENSFGYTTTQPCVLVNLNRVWGWIPENFAAEDAPDGYVNGHVLIKCKPYKDKDVAAVNATQVYPPTGIPFAYFPYVVGTNKKDQARYITPYVAVRVSLNEEEAVDRDVKVQCEAFAANLDPRGGLYDTKERSQFTVIFKLGKSAAPKDEM
ncbi:sodium/potassium-transporting ATPase subunit beta-1-like [Diadema antillarum]|uniref:sodium/potassium-transporting ATPase subunit beta-1-like n=1 Tax=Diadema antillarum TaxID=105358 RepID=UPI003A84D0C3